MNWFPSRGCLSGWSFSWIIVFISSSRNGIIICFPTIFKFSWRPCKPKEPWKLSQVGIFTRAFVLNFQWGKCMHRGLAHASQTTESQSYSIETDPLSQLVHTDQHVPYTSKPILFMYLSKCCFFFKPCDSTTSTIFTGILFHISTTLCHLKPMFFGSWFP